MKKLNTQSELDQRSSFFGVTSLQVFSKASSYLSDGAPHSEWKERIHPDRNLEGQRFGEKKSRLEEKGWYKYILHNDVYVHILHCIHYMYMYTYCINTNICI